MIGLYIRDLDIVGGTHKQFLYLLNYLAANKKPFKVITTQLDYNKTYGGFSHYKSNIVCVQKKVHNSLPLKIYYTLLFILNVKRELKGIKALNVHNLGLELYFPFLYNKNIIWQINDLPEVFQVGVHKTEKASFASRLRKKYLQFSCRYFVKAISVNVSKNRKRVQDCLNMDAEVFYCGIEKIDIQKDIQLSLERFNAGKINLLSSGVFFPYRNYETQIEVVKILKGKGYHIELNIIGPTELDRQYADKIINLISKNKLDNEVKVRGQVSEDSYKQLHANSDIFMFINVDQSWGLAVFEAMSCGLPVIVSNSVGATEILQDGYDSIFVDPLDAQLIANKIELLVKDANTYLHYVKNGIEFSKRYTWDNAYSQHMYKLIAKYQ
jgi:glycosyltransferase involved in cell wall biosynthesis